jgi:hypothetical protein
VDDYRPVPGGLAAGMELNLISESWPLLASTVARLYLLVAPGVSCRRVTTPAEQHTNELEWLFSGRGTEITEGHLVAWGCDWLDRILQDIVEAESCTCLAS